jgi:hypothetical protein
MLTMIRLPVAPTSGDGLAGMDYRASRAAMPRRVPASRISSGSRATPSSSWAFVMRRSSVIEVPPMLRKSSSGPLAGSLNSRQASMTHRSAEACASFSVMFSRLRRADGETKSVGYFTWIRRLTATVRCGRGATEDPSDHIGRPQAMWDSPPRPGRGTLPGRGYWVRTACAGRGRWEAARDAAEPAAFGPWQVGSRQTKGHRIMI